MPKFFSRKQKFPTSRYQLMQALIVNRSKQEKGKGERYWRTVVETVEKQLNITLED